MPQRSPTDQARMLAHRPIHAIGVTLACQHWKRHEAFRGAITEQRAGLRAYCRIRRQLEQLSFATGGDTWESYD